MKRGNLFWLLPEYTDRKIRWCADCAKAHAGVVDLVNKTGMPLRCTAASLAEKTEPFKLPPQVISKAQNMKEAMQLIEASENAIQTSPQCRMSKKNVKKATKAWWNHIVKDNDATCQIMCSLLSDPKDISLVKEIAQLAVSAWCCGLREARKGTVGTNWNFEQVCIAHLSH
jgi:hypothetical protein